MTNIVITDFNAVASCGIGKEEFTGGILSKGNFIKDITFFDAKDIDVKKAFQIDIDFQAVLGKGGLKHINRNAKIAMSCIEGISGIFNNYPENEKPAVIMGSAFGSADSIAEFWEVALREGFAGLRPLDFPNTTINSSGSFINIRYGITNASVTVCNGYNSSLEAFIYADDYIKNGYSKWALVGGSEELGKYNFLGQLKSGLLSTNDVYDIKLNQGYYPGEGAAFFMVEDIEFAKSNNKKIIAELVGYSSKFGKEQSVMNLCYKDAFEMAGISEKEVSVVSSGMNGLRNENYYSTYENLFSNHKNIKIVNYKEFFGECYGASGALQLAAALSDSKLKSGDYFSIDNFSIDGNNTVLIFKRN
ncbi:MAG TPA: beta-ketoacyl synthase N-terminal-like domain-containing protein [Spirochaetota bacterium]|mgnify:CR=1 FL=1|nr:beta-ketoacyl synthase N-terminal-like domain-containing protein [Spirochaetota bacterium]